jgi:hydroxypyruvate reductase
MRKLLEDSFHAVVAAADSLKVLPTHFPPPPRGRTFVAAAGKAAASMAVAVEPYWPAAAPLEGIAVTRYSRSLPTKRIRVIEAGHPVPDEVREKAAREILEGMCALGPDDLLLALISGGGSALLSLPAEGDGPYAFRTVKGTTPDGRKTLVIWRRLTGEPEQDELENRRTSDDTWKLRPIEEDFHRLMFKMEGV